MTDATLESILLEMQPFGRPRVGLYTGGWVSQIDMTVNATGAKFEIQSDFGFKSPTAAAAQCLERMRAVLHGVSSPLGKLEHTR